MKNFKSSKKLSVIMVVAGLLAGSAFAKDEGKEPSFGQQEEQGFEQEQGKFDQEQEGKEDEEGFQEQVQYQGKNFSCARIAYAYLGQELGLSEGKFDQEQSAPEFKKLKLKIKKGKKTKCKVK